MSRIKEYESKPGCLPKPLHSLVKRWVGNSCNKDLDISNKEFYYEIAGYNYGILNNIHDATKFIATYEPLEDPVDFKYFKKLEADTAFLEDPTKLTEVIVKLRRIVPNNSFSIAAYSAKKFFRLGSSHIVGLERELYKSTIFYMTMLGGVSNEIKSAEELSNINSRYEEIFVHLSEYTQMAGEQSSRYKQFQDLAAKALSSRK